MGELADRALAFATECHKGQVRKWGEKGVPYIVHPTRVAEAAAKEGMKEGAVAAAYLHDVMEDCNISFMTLKEKFGEDVAMLVDELTNASKKLPPEKRAEMNREERKKMDREHIKEICPTAKVLKCLDRIDNLNTLGPWNMNNREFFTQYLFESVQLYQVLYHYSSRRVQRAVRRLADTIVDQCEPIGDLSFKLISNELYREFECPICGFRHIANVKSRRVKGTDSVACPGCQKVRSKTHRKLTYEQEVEILDRDRERERLVRLEKREGWNMGFADRFDPEQMRARREAMAEHRRKLGLFD